MAKLTALLTAIASLVKYGWHLLQQWNAEKQKKQREKEREQNEKDKQQIKDELDKGAVGDINSRWGWDDSK